jgi:hypothetical protein
MNARTRALGLAAVALLAVWGLAWVGYSLAARSKVTVEKIQAYVHATDLRRLNERERARAIQRLADLINALSFEERRRARLAGLWRNWFEVMTEEEKGRFIEATMPTGFKKMIAAFEEWPEERRRRAVEEAVRRLREAQRRLPESRGASDANPPGALSEELQQRIAVIGLKTFYAESSAQTKAEVAPLLEELQRLMQSGRFTRGPGGQ